MGEKENIKRVLRWILLDRRIRTVDFPTTEGTIKKWEKEYLWVIDYLGEKSGR
jgi:hypothetical protein